MNLLQTAKERAESTEEATVYVNDLDVFVTMMLREESPAVLSLVWIYYAKKWEYSKVQV